MEEDFISQLPDELLSRIISSLPFECSLMTTFLSTRWRDLWKPSSVQYGPLEEIPNAIQIFLSQFEELNPLKHSRNLKWYINPDNFILATIAPTKRLILDFSRIQQPPYPADLFSWSLQLNNSESIVAQPSPSTYYVKVLHLTSVGNLTANIISSSLVSCLQFLESLKITKCKALKSLNIVGCGKLLQLTVSDCPQLKSLYIKAYELESLRYQGPLPWFHIEYKFYLRDAELQLDQRKQSRSFENEDFLKLLEALADAKSLTVNSWTYQEFISHWLQARRVDLLNLEELFWTDKNRKTEVLLSLLKFCPFLKRLKIQVDELNTGKSLNQVVKCTQLGHLSVIKLEGFINRNDEKLLANHFFEMATLTEPLILSRPNGSCSWKMLNIARQKRVSSK